jgi:hypothetical protein
MFAVLDEQPAQLLDDLEKSFALLLDQHTAKQDTQRTDVAA